jgi:hypothetical protein
MQQGTDRLPVSRVPVGQQGGVHLLEERLESLGMARPQNPRRPTVRTRQRRGRLRSVPVKAQGNEPRRMGGILAVTDAHPLPGEKHVPPRQADLLIVQPVDRPTVLDVKQVQVGNREFHPAAPAGRDAHVVPLMHAKADRLRRPRQQRVQIRAKSSMSRFWHAKTFFGHGQSGADWQ